MDGVLADTIGQIAKHTGIEPENFKQRWAAQHPGTYHPHLLLNTSHDELWASIARSGEDWWLNIEPLPHLQDLIWAVRNAVGDRWDVLTSPQANLGCYVGKIKWLKREFGPLFTRFHLHENKALLAGPGRVLIDDYDENCRRWMQAGGIAITFPQPWNRLHELAAEGPERAIQYVERCLAEAVVSQRSRMF